MKIEYNALQLSFQRERDDLLRQIADLQEQLTAVNRLLSSYLLEDQMSPSLPALTSLSRLSDRWIASLPATPVTTSEKDFFDTGRQIPTMSQTSRRNYTVSEEEDGEVENEGLDCFYSPLLRYPTGNRDSNRTRPSEKRERKEEIVSPDQIVSDCFGSPDVVGVGEYEDASVDVDAVVWSGRKMLFAGIDNEDENLLEMGRVRGVEEGRYANRERRRSELETESLLATTVEQVKVEVEEVEQSYLLYSPQRLNSFSLLSLFCSLYV